VGVTAGAVTALVGVTGSGKTTLLEILAGRLWPHGGQVRWRGARLAHPTLAALARRGVIYVPDRPWLSMRLRVGRQPELAGRIHGAEWRGIARATGIESMLERKPPSLSMGEQRLCEVALAWTCRPAALVLDEPSHALEPLHREAVARLRAALAGDGVGVLFADHDVEMVRRIADRVFAIEQGRTRLS
jgi:ABC-type multidrug transport system ATPase subunit